MGLSVWNPSCNLDVLVRLNEADLTQGALYGDSLFLCPASNPNQYLLVVGAPSQTSTVFWAFFSNWLKWNEDGFTTTTQEGAAYIYAVNGAQSPVTATKLSQVRYPQKIQIGINIYWS